MFDQVLAENTARTRRPLAVALSFSGQLLLVGLVILLPVLHTEGINPNRTLRIVTAPRPFVELVESQQRASSSPVRSHDPARPVLSAPVLRQPTHVPDAIVMDADEAPSSFSAGPAGPPSAGDPTGVFGSTGDGAPQPPTPTPPNPSADTPADYSPHEVGGNVQAARLVNQVKPALSAARQADSHLGHRSLRGDYRPQWRHPEPAGDERTSAAGRCGARGGASVELPANLAQRRAGRGAHANRCALRTRPVSGRLPGSCRARVGVTNVCGGRLASPMIVPSFPGPTWAPE